MPLCDFPICLSASPRHKGSRPRSRSWCFFVITVPGFLVTCLSFSNWFSLSYFTFFFSPRRLSPWSPPATVFAYLSRRAQEPDQPRAYNPTAIATAQQTSSSLRLFCTDCTGCSEWSGPATARWPTPETRSLARLPGLNAFHVVTTIHDRTPKRALVVLPVFLPAVCTTLDAAQRHQLRPLGAAQSCVEPVFVPPLERDARPSTRLRRPTPPPNCAEYHEWPQCSVVPCLCRR